MVRRSRAREVALQILFQDDLNPQHNPADAEAFLRRRLGRDGLRPSDSLDNEFVEKDSLPLDAFPSDLIENDLVAFARQLVAGVRRDRADLDERITEAAANWRLERMAVTDRNVLRLGVFELLHTDTPPAVVINEAIELAKRFGTAQSGAFVNGILDKLNQQP